MAKATYIDRAIENAVPLAVGAVLIIGAIYFLLRKTISDAASGAGGVLSGNNALTEGTPYANTGILGTLGAGVNAVLGGAPRAVGETVSSWFTPNVAPTGNLFYTVTFPDGSRHAVVDTAVTRDGYFTYQGKKYRLGIDRSNNRIAVAA